MLFMFFFLFIFFHPKCVGKRIPSVFNWDFFQEIIQNLFHFGWKRFAITIIVVLSRLDVLFFINVLFINLI